VSGPRSGRALGVEDGVFYLGRPGFLSDNWLRRLRDEARAARRHQCFAVLGHPESGKRPLCRIPAGLADSEALFQRLRGAALGS
jgi:hypothetical protein